MISEVRRCIDGSIDIEFYRDRGLAQRRAEMAAVFKGIARFVFTVSRAGHARPAPAPAH